MPCVSAHFTCSSSLCDINMFMTGWSRPKTRPEQQIPDQRKAKPHAHTLLSYILKVNVSLVCVSSQQHSHKNLTALPHQCKSRDIIHTWSLYHCEDTHWLNGFSSLPTLTLTFTTKVRVQFSPFPLSFSSNLPFCTFCCRGVVILFGTWYIDPRTEDFQRQTRNQSNKKLPRMPCTSPGTRTKTPTRTRKNKC